MGRFGGVRHEVGPRAGGLDDLGDLIEVGGSSETDGHGLRMTPQAAHPYGESVDGDRRGSSQDSGALGLSLPLFAGATVFQRCINPRQEVPGEWVADAAGRMIGMMHACGDCLRDVERTGAGSNLRTDFSEIVHLVDKFHHLLCSGTTCSLVGHGGKKPHQISAKETTQSHEQQAHGAVSAHEVPLSGGQCCVDERPVDRVEHDGAVWLHPKGTRGVDPGSLPPGCPQLRMCGAGPGAPLTGHDGLAA